MLYNYTEMWPERLKRIILVAAAGVLLMLAGKVFADWRATKLVKGEAIKLPTELVTGQLGELGEMVLGKAIEILPGGGQVKEKIIEKESPTTQTTQTETTKIIESQTKEIMEIIKQLPQNQVDQIKKQIFKDFCQEVLGE